MAMTSLAWLPASLPCLLLLLLITLQVDSLSRNHKELEFSIEDVTRVRIIVTCHVSRVTCNLSHVRVAWTRCWTQTISRRCFGTLEIARGVKMF